MTAAGSRLTFDGRAVLVTGAGRGVGRATALAFAERGARVVVNDLGGDDGPVADAVVKEICQAGGTAIAHEGDVSDPKAAAGMIRAAVDAFGRVDVVVNNAGIDRIAPLPEVTADLLARFFDVHVAGTYNVCAAAWPHFAEQEFGRIVNTTSSAGYFGLARALPYATAKGALHGLTQTLALEGRRHGVTVNAVAPFAASRLAAARTRARPELYDAIERFAPAAAVAPAVLWLAHESTTVTGQAYEAGAGAVTRIVVGAAAGVATEDELTPELLRDSPELLSTAGAEFPDVGGADRPLTRWIAGLAARQPSGP